MVALPEPRPETPRQAERRQAIENVQRSLLGRQLYGSELTPAGLAARQREGIEALKGMGVGLPAGLLGLPADLLALLVRDAPSLLNKLVTGEPLDIEERGQFAKAFDAFQKVAGAEAIARAMGFGENLDAESEGSDAASRAGMNPFRQGMLTTELVADPFLAVKGIGALLKAGSRTDTPATRSTDLVPVDATADTPTTTFPEPAVPEPERRIVDFTPADADPDDEMDIFSFGVDMVHTPTGSRVSSDTIIRGRISEFETAEGRDASLVNRTEFTQRMATQEETDAFMRGDTVEGEFTPTPGTAPEGDEANQLFDAASQARALENIEDSAQQAAASTQQVEAFPEVGIGTTPPADEALGAPSPTGPEFTYDSLGSIPGYQRKPDRKSQNLVYTVDDTGEFKEKVDNFSPVLTNLHAQEETKKIGKKGIRPSELDKRLLQGAMKSEYKDSPFQDELLRLSDEGDEKISSTAAIVKAEDLLPQVRSRMFFVSKIKEDHADGVTPYGNNTIPHIGNVTNDGAVNQLDTQQITNDVSESAQDAAVITFSTNKPDTINVGDGTVIENVSSAIKDSIDHGYRLDKVPGWFGWARTSVVVGQDGKKYLVVNEIQSNGIRDFEAGSGVNNFPNEPGTFEVDAIRGDGSGDVIETVTFQDTPEGRAEFDRFVERVDQEGNIRSVKRPKPGKNPRIKTLDERLNAFFEADPHQTGKTAGEVGRVRIPWNDEAKAFQKAIDEHYPKDVVKSDLLDAEAADLERKLTELLDFGTPGNSSFIRESVHPHIILNENISSAYRKLTSEATIFGAKQELDTLLPVEETDSFYTRLRDETGSGVALEVVDEFLTVNSSYVEDVIENILRSRNLPTTVESVSLFGKELRKQLENTARHYRNNYATGEMTTPQDFKDYFITKSIGREKTPRSNMIVQAAGIQKVSDTNSKVYDFLNNPSPEQVQAFESGELDKINAVLDDIMSSVSDEEVEAFVKGVKEQKQMLRERYGNVMDEAKNPLYVDIEELITDYENSLAADEIRPDFAKEQFEDFMRQSLKNIGNEHTGTSYYNKGRDVLQFMDTEARLSQLNLSGERLTSAEKQEKLEAARSSMEAVGLDLDKVDAFNKVKTMSGEGRKTGFILTPPFKTQSDFFKYATRSILKNAREEEGIDGVIFLSGEDMHRIHGPGRPKDGYVNTYGTAIDKALREFEDGAVGGTVRRNVNKRDQDRNLVSAEPEKIFRVMPNVPSGRTDPFLIESQGDGLRIINFDDGSNMSATTRPIRRAKGGEVDLRPRKMIHSGIGAMAKEVM